MGNVTEHTQETPNTKTTVSVYRETGEVFYTFCRRVGAFWKVVKHTKFQPADPEHFAAVLLGKVA